VPRFERRAERRLVDKLAAGAVDQPDALLGLCERLRVERKPAKTVFVESGGEAFGAS
jgi:hypothetical protein